MCVVQPCVSACVCLGVCARAATCLKLDCRAAASVLFTCGGISCRAANCMSCGRSWRPSRQLWSDRCVTPKESRAKRSSAVWIKISLTSYILKVHILHYRIMYLEWQVFQVGRWLWSTLRLDTLTGAVTKGNSAEFYLTVRDQASQKGENRAKKKNPNPKF